MLPNDDWVWQILFRFALLFFLVSSAAGVAVGVGLIVRGARTLRWLGALNRWISTRESLEPLDVPRDIGPAVRRHRRWLGAALAAIGGYALFTLLTRIRPAAMTDVFGVQSWGVVLVEGLWWVLAVGSMATVAIGILLVFFPGILGAIEARLNRWVSSRQAVAGGDEMHLTLDRFVQSNPRAAGWIITLLCIVATGASAMLLFARP